MQIMNWVLGFCCRDQPLKETLKEMRALVTQILQCRELQHHVLLIPKGPMLTHIANPLQPRGASPCPYG